MYYSGVLSFENRSYVEPWGLSLHLAWLQFKCVCVSEQDIQRKGKDLFSCWNEHSPKGCEWMVHSFMREFLGWLEYGNWGHAVDPSYGLWANRRIFMGLGRWVKCLLHKYEDLCVDLQYPCKSMFNCVCVLYYPLWKWIWVYLRSSLASQARWTAELWLHWQTLSLKQY